MKVVAKQFGRFARNEDGATAIEYGLMAALVAVGSILAITAFGTSLTGLFGHINATAGDAMVRASLD